MSKEDVIKQCASAFIATLTKEELAYCTDNDRGVYKGFASLHDLMDANVELVSAIVALSLPLEECPIKEDFNKEQIPFLNKVMDEINIQLKGETER